MQRRMHRAPLLVSYRAIITATRSAAGAQNIFGGLRRGAGRAAFVDKFLPRYVIRPVGTVKILVHVFEFFGAVGRKRFAALIIQALVMLFAQKLPKILVVREALRPAHKYLFELAYRC